MMNARLPVIDTLVMCDLVHIWRIRLRLGCKCARLVTAATRPDAAGMRALHGVTAVWKLPCRDVDVMLRLSGHAAASDSLPMRCRVMPFAQRTRLLTRGRDASPRVPDAS
jgi:hypothetical protein